MSEPIKVGDLVQVIRPEPCCGNPTDLGLVFVVQKMNLVQMGQCSKCRRYFHDEMGVDHPANRYKYFQLPRLKRIPPLSELEGERTQEDIREPA